MIDEGVTVRWLPFAAAVRVPREAARDAVRTALARHAGVGVADVEIAGGRDEKPRLGGILAARDVRFSYARTGGLVALAIATGREVGIDVERIDRRLDVDELAARFCSPAEYRAYGELPAALRADAFFAWWTRKEAFVKALGRGLQFPLDAFDVALDPRRAPSLLAAREGVVAADWTLLDVAAPPGYAAGVAVASAHVRTARTPTVTT